ncbi:unnamed protein product [Haemonchus placei]|uniref:Dynein light chain n=1 Tax=Haemonchus placei TaxID=6290 RepID=A0A0N4X752_HAEPC|nr:unnamed protein product [Haemonchus placei]
MASMNDAHLNSPEQRREDGSKHIKSTIKSAKEFIESDAFATITKDKVTVDGEREKLNIMCTTPERMSHSLVCSVLLVRRNILTNLYSNVFSVFNDTGTNYTYH